MVFTSVHYLNNNMFDSRFRLVQFHSRAIRQLRLVHLHPSATRQLQLVQFYSKTIR